MSYEIFNMKFIFKVDNTLRLRISYLRKRQRYDDKQLLESE